MATNFLFSIALADTLIKTENEYQLRRLAIGEEFVKLFGWVVNMNWASKAIEELKSGQNVIIYPRGNSMQPKIESGAAVTLEPVIDASLLKKGDIVLVAVGQTIYLHLITALEKERVQIANNKGHVNGWVMNKNVFGRAIEIDNHPKQK